MNNGKTITILTGIYPPDSGGPARFASVFPKWLLTKKNVNSNVISYTDMTSDFESQFEHEHVYLFSRKRNIAIRYFNVIRKILKISHSKNSIIANGMFIEILGAKLTKWGLKYTAKVPGDIVWERSRNKKRTTLSIIDFQNSKLDLKDKVFRVLFTYSLKFAEKVIVPSLELKILCQNWGVPTNKIEIIGNAVDENHFKLIETKKDIDVLCVSRLVAWKNLDSVIHVTKNLNKNLFIAGEGEDLEDLRILAESLHHNVTFLGSVDYQNLPALYNRAKLFVLNSDYEGMPYSLIEAQMCGVFAIANGKTGSSEVITEGLTGYLTTSSAEKDLEEAINRYFTQFPNGSDGLTIRKTAISRFSVANNFEKIFQLQVANVK